MLQVGGRNEVSQSARPPRTRMCTTAPPGGQEEKQDWNSQLSLGGVPRGPGACDLSNKEDTSQVKPENQAEFLAEMCALKGRKAGTLEDVLREPV